MTIHSHLTIWLKNIFQEYWYITSYSHGLTQTYHMSLNKVSGQHFSAENKQEAAEFYSQHLPMHSRGVIWRINSKSNFPVSFSLISAEMNLVGNYRTLRGLRTINPEELPSTMISLAPRWHLEVMWLLSKSMINIQRGKCVYYLSTFIGTSVLGDSSISAL